MSVRPTNSWFQAFMVESGRKPVHTVPYLVVSNDTGLDVCFPTLDTTTFNHAVIAPMVANISLRSLSGLSAPKVTAFTDLGCTVTWTGGALANVVRGSAYASMTYTATRPVVATTHAITSVNGSATDNSSTSTFTGTKFKLGLDNGQTWIVYTSASVAFTIASGNTLTAGATLTGTVRVAYLPSGGLESVLDTGATAIQTGGSVEMVISGSTYTKTFTYSVTGTGSPVAYAMPHHQDVLVSPNYPGLTINGTMRGTLKAVTGAVWTLAMPVSMPSWNNANAIASDKLQAVKDSLAIDKAYVPVYNDPYFGSKYQAKSARLALIADQVGDTAARDQLLNAMKPVISAFLDGTDPDSKLVYDTIWGGLVSDKGRTDFQADFGNGVYNDHYFHYGYLIYTAAVLGKYDAAWLAAYKPKINALVRDIANPAVGNGDPFFTPFRHFDHFEGHAWASGLKEDSQANQESTSEAVNAWYGIYLWGITSSQPGVANLGKALYTEETRTAQKYWQILQATSWYPANIKAYGCLGIIWSFKYEVGTWFSTMTAQLEHVHGIQILPITPATEQLIPKAWITETWTNNLLPLLSRNPAPTQAWWSILVTAHAQADPADAWTRLSGISNEVTNWDDGFSKTQALYHIATQTPALTPAYSIWGNTAHPGALTKFTETPITVATAFYTAGTSANGWRCVGGRLYVPAGFTVPTTAQMSVWQAGASVSLANTPDRTATLANIVAGQWNEVRWATPLVMIPGQPVWVGYKFADGTYLAVGSLTDGVIQSNNTPNLYIADRYEFGSMVDDPQGSRSRFRYDTGALGRAGGHWGIDILVDTGA